MFDPSSESIAILFGKYLRSTRINRGISQESLAHISNVDRSFLSKIELGKRQVTLTTLLKLSIGLKIVPSEMVEACINPIYHDQNEKAER